MSPTLIIVAVIVLAILVIATLLRAKLGRQAPADVLGAGNHYELRKTIVSPAERSFLGVLEGSLPDEVAVLAKIRLGDVFKTRKGLSPSKRATAANRIDRKHVDFLLVHTSDLAPLAGIELDDSSHEREDRKARDTFVDDVFRACNLPLLHVPAEATYNSAALRTKLANLISS